MSIYVYVEGQTEVLSLPGLLVDCYASRRLRRPIALGARFLMEIGRTAAEVLLRETGAHVFACPDLAPNRSHLGHRWAYTTYEGLSELLHREVRDQLKARTNTRGATTAIQRFHPHPFRHDFEVVILACPDRLKRHLRTDADVTKWYKANPEDQNFDEYPSKMLAKLFSKFARTRYRKTYDAPRMLDRLTESELRAVCKTCPRFGEFVTALRRAVGVAARQR